MCYKATSGRDQPMLKIIRSYRLQTELKYPSKNRRRFTQRYNMTKIIFSERAICALFNSAVEEFKTLCKRFAEAQVYYTKKKCFLRNIFILHINIQHVAYVFM